MNAKFFHETLDGAWVLNITDDIYSAKWLGTIWMIHVAYAANELAVLYLNGWLAFNRAFCSVLSEFLWKLHLPHLHLQRSATGYMLCVQQQYVLNT